MSTKLNNPDFAALAELFGVAGYRANTAEELFSTLTTAIENRKPALIEVTQPPTPELSSLMVMKQEPPRPIVNIA